jgi:hypothetical protein
MANGPLLARCIVCHGNIHADEPHEVWEGGYYCERHSLPYLRARARAYRELLHNEESVGSRQEAGEPDTGPLS